MTNPNREFLNDPERWPNWPCQTMKRYSDVVKKNGYRHRDREVATFVERAEGEFVLVEKNIYLITSPEIEAADRTTVDKVLKQGWVVD